jgi:hypothetical protein
MSQIEELQMFDTENLHARLAGEAVKETFAIWQAGCESYIAYLTELAASRSAQDLMTANAGCLSRNANIFASAGGLLLERAGVRSPVLSDA